MIGIYNKWPAPTPSNLTKTGDFNLIYKFSNTVAEIVSESERSEAIRVPDSLYSLEVLAGEESSHLDELPEAIVFEARFDGRLIASIINGFQGLGNIPHAGVLKFLHRHPAAQRELFKYFDTRSSSMAKSFAENVFLACVESDNIDVVRFLINKKLVDANKVVCQFKGENYTPLQNAAIHQSFRVVEYLISRVDVNMSFSRVYQLSALDLLIHHMANPRSTLDEAFLRLVDAFLEEKATISMELVHMILRNFVDLQLVGRLLKNLATQTPRTLFSRGDLLQNIVKNLAERDAVEIVQLINDNCGSLGGDRYLRKSHQVDNAFPEAMERKYNELVGIMLPYISSPRRALRMAIEANNGVATQLILRGNPGLEVDNTEDGDTIIFALRSKDQNFLRGLETRGVFDRLRGHKLGQVLTVALEAGNREYAIKILDIIDPDLNSYGNSIAHGLDDSQVFDMSAALSAAFTHNFDDIAWKLLAFSLAVLRPQSYMSSSFYRLRPSAPLLYATLKAKRLEFARAIMEYDPNKETFRDDGYGFLEFAIESGQDLLFDLFREDMTSMSSHPTEPILKLALEKGRKDLFLNVIESNLQGGPCMWEKGGLSVAVACGSESLLDELISMGASADDDEILNKAIHEYPSMVKPLLDQYWKVYPQGRPEYGDLIISKTLDLHPKPYGCLSVDMLFTLKLINPNNLFQEYPGAQSLFAKALSTRKYDIIKMFIDAGSDVNDIMIYQHEYPNDKSRTTALLSTIGTDTMEIVELLVNHSANVNEPARHGIRWTPLQKAAEVNNISIVRLLLNNGADVNSAPALFHGATALQFAAINGNCEMATTLIEHGARYDIPPSRGTRGRWPLEGAAENGRFDMIELLWSAFGPFPDEQCQKAMRLAEHNGRFGCKEKIAELMARSAVLSNTLLTTTSSTTGYT